MLDYLSGQQRAGDHRGRDFVFSGALHLSAGDVLLVGTTPEEIVAIFCAHTRLYAIMPEH